MHAAGLAPGWTTWGGPVAVGLIAAALGILAGFDPKLALIGSLAGVFAVVAFTDLTIGLAGFILVSFIGLHPFGLYDALARLILALAWFAVIATGKRRALEFPSIHPIAASLLALLVVWAGISTSWAEDSGVALDGALQYALSALLMMITFTAVQTRRDLLIVLVAFVIGAIAATVTGLLDPSAGADPDRLESDVLDANLLAAALVAGLGLSVGAIAIQRPGPGRLLLMCGALLMAAGVALTASRSALIALGVCLLTAIVIGGRWRVPLLVAAITIAGATYVYFAGFASDGARERVTGPLRGEERTDDGRSTIWAVAWRAFEDNPINGVGAGNFPTVSVHYLLEPGPERSPDQIIDDPKRKVAHNSYLSVLSELGLIGFALFVSILVFAFASMLKAASLFDRAGDRRMQIVALSTAIALLGLLTVSFFQTDQQGKGLWLLLGLGPALLAIAKTGGRRPGPAA